MNNCAAQMDVKIMWESNEVELNAKKAAWFCGAKLERVAKASDVKRRKSIWRNGRRKGQLNDDDQLRNAAALAAAKALIQVLEVMFLPQCCEA